MSLQAPFPWFGGKSKVANLVWQRFGDVPNYVEPFGGSLAVLLGRPSTPKVETVNDLDGYVSNFWRAIRADPEETAKWADWPVNENDLSARHIWLLAARERLTARLNGDPDYYDAKVAGWWVWGICSWIGSGWCSGEGPWVAEEGELSKLPHLGNAGRGINRQLPHLGNAGRGINRQLPHLGDAGQGEGIYAWFAALSERLRNVRVCSGDWTRVLGPTPTEKLGMAAVFLDPPYSGEERTADLYTRDSGTVAADVLAWCIANGANPNLRIALCGYAGEGHEPLEELGWDVHAWKAKGGYGSQGQGDNANAKRERIWFSPACIPHNQGVLL